MIRETMVRTAENVRGGQGTVIFNDILKPEELNGHGTLYSKVTLKKGCSIGFHVHTNNTEPYFILSGKGIFVDNDGSRNEVKAGDCCLIEVGQGHAMENPFDEDLVFMALIYNE